MSATGSSTKRLAQALAEIPSLRTLPDHRAFERLAAIVLRRWFDEPTIHNVTLRGASGAPHQIDVLIGDDRQRALVECKYYGRSVDMPVVRNFYGAIADLGYDFAAIVSTIGFSRNVKLFAAAHDIDLLLIRDSVDSDLHGRVTQIDLEITAFMAHMRACRVILPPDADEENGAQHRVSLMDESYQIEHTSGRSVPFAARYREIEASFGFDDADGIYPVADDFSTPTWLVFDGNRIPVVRIEWEWVVSRSTTTSTIKHEALVSLVDANGDVLEVVSDEQVRHARTVARARPPR